MNEPPDAPPPTWAWSWASKQFQTLISSATQVRSNEINQVFRLEVIGESRFLKIGPNLEREYERLQWLEGRLPCPRPLGFITHNGTDGLLMSAVEGDDLAHLSASLPAEVIIARLAAALKAIHATSTADWPFGGTGGVLVHGDACLPNFLFMGDHLSGYIDVGDMALADPEVDLAAAVWSLQYNMGAGHGLAFLREYGVVGMDEEDVERLRLSYERGNH